MTPKKRHQYGSRTHGSGTHKNRRGAGHRGGRGHAGRGKHESHNYEPLGRYGSERPGVLQDGVAEVKVWKLDKDVTLLAADGVAERDGDTYVIDAHDMAEDGWGVDVVKVLGGGQVRNESHVITDALAAGAAKLIEETGGDAKLSERAEEAAEAEGLVDADEGDKE